MSAHKHSDGTWYWTRRLPDEAGALRQVKRRGYPTKEKALAAEADALRDARNGRRVSPTTITFGAYLTDRWLPSIEASPRLRPQTVASYRHMVKHLVRHLGHVRLDRLAPDDLNRLYGALRADGKAEATVRAVHVAARKSLKDAVRWRLLTWNPADDADAPAQPRPRPKAWEAADVGRFLDAVHDDRLSPLWRMAATTGMRRGELLGLRWRSIDLEAGHVVVQASRVVVDHEVVDQDDTKTGRARGLVLDPETVAVLRAWRRQQAAERLAMGAEWPGEDLVFTWPTGEPVHPDYVTRRFNKLRADLDLPPLSLHKMRHAMATTALKAGVDVKTVSARLGHASVRTTYDIYAAAIPGADAEAATSLADAFRGNTSWQQKG